MSTDTEKCAVIIDGSLPVGVIANIAAILGITAGMKAPYIVGEDVYDSEGSSHSGIIRFPVPVLKGNAEILKDIHKKAEELGISAADFTGLAQSCKTYDEYILKMSVSSESSLEYLGIAVFGDKRSVNRLTGSLPLLK